MKTTQGFVAVRPSGEFIQVDRSDTHTGFHIQVHLCDNIEEATVFNIPGFASRDVRMAVIGEHTWVPVEIRREVILKGFGVSPS